MIKHIDHPTTRHSVNLGAYVPPDLAQRLADLAQRHDRSRSGELREALRAWLDQHSLQQEVAPIANTDNAN